MLVQTKIVFGRQPNPLRRIFPYGVYASGNNPERLPNLNYKKDKELLRESIHRVCKDLVNHNMNCIWINNLDFGLLPTWLEAGKKYGVHIVVQGGGPPGYVKPYWFKDKEDFAKRVEPYYKKLAEQYRNSSALLAWSITEENKPIEWFYQAIGELADKMRQ